MMDKRIMVSMDASLMECCKVMSREQHISTAAFIRKLIRQEQATQIKGNQ